MRPSRRRGGSPVGVGSPALLALVAVPGAGLVLALRRFSGILAAVIGVVGPGAPAALVAAEVFLVLPAGFVACVLVLVELAVVGVLLHVLPRGVHL